MRYDISHIYRVTSALAHSSFEEIMDILTSDQRSTSLINSSKLYLIRPILDWFLSLACSLIQHLDLNKSKRSSNRESEGKSTKYTSRG